MPSLLDARQYKEWLELFTDDAIYWMPTGGDNLDPEKATSLIYDDRRSLNDRLDRLLHPALYGGDGALGVGHGLPLGRGSRRGSGPGSRLRIESDRKYETGPYAALFFATSSDGSYATLTYMPPERHLHCKTPVPGI